MATPWSDNAIRTLGDSTSCPRCGAALTNVGACDNCRADLNSPEAHELWTDSQSLADAIRRWRRLVDRLPTLTASAVVVTAPAVVERAPAPRPAPAPASSGSHISQQTVLAIAGAALVAIAALVFTFLNPDLTDFATRTWIIGAVTALFLGGSWLLARQGLRVSAETIGALGLVFVGLDIWAFSGIDQTNGILLAAVGLLAASIALALLALGSGVHVWLWGALLGLLATPAIFGYASGGAWPAVVGHLGVVAVAVVVLELLPRLDQRLTGARAALRVTAMVAQVGGFCAVSAQVAFLITVGDRLAVFPGVAALIALAALAALSTRSAYPGPWSFAAGALFAASVAALPMAFDLRSSVWLVVLVPAAAVLAIVLLTTICSARPLGTVSSGMLQSGASLVVAITVMPSATMTLLRLATLGQRALSDDAEAAAALGLAVVAVGSAVFARLSTKPAARTRALVVSLWFATAALLGFAAWSALALPTQLSISLAAAAVLAVAAARIAVIRTAQLALRAPLVAAAHALVVVSAALSWATPLSGVLGGIVVIAVSLGLAWWIPAAPRAIYVGVAYAYGLIVIAAAIGLVGLPTIAVLSLTSTAASALALVATLVRRLTTPAWYALLAVTAVPFVLGVASVLLERSGWSALSTSATFALALVLALSRRAGLTSPLRRAAAALLVPALSVVIVCVCAQFFDSSGSPIALPVIAAIVAVVLPTTDAIGHGLERRGIAPVEARSVRIAVESTALLTAAIATLLAVVRIAAGLETTLLVLALVGAGGAAAAVFAHRRYGWIIAGAAWTGALWSAYGILGVAVPEAYLLPPAIAATVVGAFGVARARASRGLFVGGLVAAVVPPMVVLAVDGGATRVVGLLAGAGILVVLGAIVARVGIGSRLRPLAALTGPALVVAIAAAASGVLQAARWGTGLDRNPVVDALTMLPILGLGLAATAIATVAAHRFARATDSRSRWLYVPAAVYFAAAPTTGIEHSWPAIWTMWGVMASLLAAMLVTTRIARERAVTLPPVWLLFALAWCAAVIGWSERELRVEAFSLPLGLALLAAGVIALRGAAERPEVDAGLASWPIGFSGSWHLLAPGLIVTLAPSVLSTATDPLTARAVLVIGLALVAILVGSKLRLAAPFVLGIVVLPIENVVVFSVQIGRSIGAAPWWITLATAGAVLLVLAVTSERRVSTEHGVAARLRDLR